MLPAIILSLIASVVPALLYAILFYWADRYEREPIWLGIAAFVWGALPAIIVSFYGEFLLSVALIQSPNSVAGTLAGTTVIVPIVEEVIKGAALFAIFIWKYNEFDNALDGLVYGALVGLGFAMTENFLYFVGAFGSGGYTALTTVIFLRAILFGLNHAFYTSLLGICLGLSREKSKLRERLGYPIIGLIAAIIVHAIHNLAIIMTAFNQLSIIFSLLLAMLSLFLFFIVIRVNWNSERHIFEVELLDEIGFTITNDEYRKLLDNWHRPLRRGNKHQRQEARRLHLSAELAFHKQRLHKLGAEREPDLPRQIGRIRTKLLQSLAG
ncbi:MAG: PrsW family intramembrane metalloprotease [Chloroflexota bacterium]